MQLTFNLQSTEYSYSMETHNLVPILRSLSWLSSNSSCEVTHFDVSIYGSSNINDATSENDLVSLFNYTTMEESIELPTSVLHDNYFNISASNMDSNCLKSEHIYSTFPSG